jgi:hypothetical protein
MKRRTLVLLSMTIVLVGTVTVLAQQSSAQAVVPTDTHHGTTGYHHDGEIYGVESAPLSQHLAVARSQLMEARREVNPSARIDRVITALDELVLALEAIGGPVAPVGDHGAGHNEGHTPGHATHSGGCG